MLGIKTPTEVAVRQPGVWQVGAQRDCAIVLGGVLVTGQRSEVWEQLCVPARKSGEHENHS